MNVGDNVEYTRTTMRGSSIEMRQVYGQIVEMNDRVAVLKLRNGKKRVVSKRLLHVTGSGPNQLTRMLDDKFGD